MYECKRRPRRFSVFGKGLLADNVGGPGRDRDQSCHGTVGADPGTEPAGYKCRDPVPNVI